MDIEAINQRIDEVIVQNRNSYYTVIFMSVGIFLLGVALLIVEIILEKTILIGFTIAVNLLLYWPIKSVLRIRRENVSLAVTLTVLQTCRDEDVAASEIQKLLAFMRGENEKSGKNFG